ncbi:MAG: hypothetical protein LBQ15_12765 [Clostridium sp.]|jgi:hypothetical protein|nr:hypothetical protein [Clostridium sp.]
MFNERQTIFLIWCTILNQRDKGDRIIKNTYELMRRLNIQDTLDAFYDISMENVEDAFSLKPVTHCFPNVMTSHIWSSIMILRTIEIKDIFANIKNYHELDQRLIIFRGIGKHKIRVLCEILNFLGMDIEPVGTFSCTALYDAFPLYIHYLEKLEGK